MAAEIPFGAPKQVDCRRLPYGDSVTTTGTRIALAGLGVLAALGAKLIQSAPQWKPAADEVSAAGQTIVVGLIDDPSSQNPWAIWGINQTVWNSYIAQRALPQLFAYTPETWQWVPSLAVDSPTPVTFDEEKALWYSTVKLRQDRSWSDGTPVTAHDVAFTFTAIAELGAARLGGYFTNLAPPEILSRVEALDDYTVEFWLQRPDARYRFGTLLAPIMQRQFWAPRVKAALATDDPINTIVNDDVTNEPVAGAFLRGVFERGSFVDRRANPRYTPSEQRLYANGAVAVDDGHGGAWTGSIEPEGEPRVVVSSGPHAAGVHYRIYGSQAASVLALQAGEIDFLFTSLGLEKGFADQLRTTPGITIIENPANGIRFMGFNMRREPMARLPFRQAVATLIDKEFVTKNVLQGVAYPLDSVVPPGNVAWYDPNLPVYGRGLTRGERIREAVRLLESGGFSWTTRPQVAADGTLTRPGEGLRLPNGKPVPPLELLTPTEAYDALRSTFGLWVERWLREVGIPVRRVTLAFNALTDRVYDEQNMDMWILGFSLDPYPSHLHNFFHSRYRALRLRNASGYASPEYDALADEFVGEVNDLDHAKELAFRLQEMLAHDLPYLPLFETPIVEGYRSDRLRFPTTRTLDGLQGAPIPGLLDSVQLE